MLGATLAACSGGQDNPPDASVDDDCDGAADGDVCSVAAVGDGRCRDGVCVVVGCMDGVVDVGEACDDGNDVDGDECTNACALPTCGDGVQQIDEECDDGTANGDDQACTTRCLVALCGDAKVWLTVEVCDDGKQCTNGLSCTADASVCASIDDGSCAVRVGDGCGNGCAIETGWLCPTAGAPCLETCGDGVMVGGEQCDNGLDNGATDCAYGPQSCSVCTAGDLDAGGCLAVPGTPHYCGDTDAELGFGEVCDNGGTCSGNGTTACTTDDDCLVAGGVCAAVNGDGCSADCLSDETCGNAYVDFNEDCDDFGGVPVAGDGCDAVCDLESGYSCPTPGSACAPVCGDGLLKGTETCDEGFTTPSGGCVACQEQTGWACTTPGAACASLCNDGSVVGSEMCDDDNATCGTCNATCTAVLSAKAQAIINAVSSANLANNELILIADGIAFHATLTGALTSGATTVTVDSTGGYAATGVLVVEREYMIYSARTATTFTVTRGAFGSTAAAHTVNQQVSLVNLFEFQSNCGNVTAGRVCINRAIGASAANIAINIRDAINGQTGPTFALSATSSSTVVAVSNNNNGASGNVALRETVASAALTVSKDTLITFVSDGSGNMSGGQGGDCAVSQVCVVTADCRPGFSCTGGTCQ